MSKIGLIIGREFTQRVRKRSFLLTTFLTPLAMVALVLVPVLMANYGGDNQERQIVVTDHSGAVAANITSSGNMTFVIDSLSHNELQAKYPAAYGFLELGSDVVANPSSVKLYTRQSSTMAIENTIKSTLSQIITNRRIAQSGVVGLDSLMHAVQAKVSMQTYELEVDQTKEGASHKSSATSMVAAYVAGFLIYMFVLAYGMMVLQGVVEEKSNRIIELMVSSVRPFQLMMGKILGIALVALLQFTLWVVVGLALLALLPAIDPSIVAAAGAGAGGTPAAMNPSVLGGVFSTLIDPWFLIKMVGSFLIFFVGGYLLYAAMFAAVGSAVDSVADTQQLQIPITIPLIVAIVVMMSVMQAPDSSAAFWFSIIPLTSPIIMMARIPYGVPLWEFILSVVLLYGSFVALTALAAKIYRVGIFMYGKKPSLGEIIRWTRYKN